MSVEQNSRGMLSLLEYFQGAAPLIVYVLDWMFKKRYQKRATDAWKSLLAPTGAATPADQAVPPEKKYITQEVLIELVESSAKNSVDTTIAATMMIVSVFVIASGVFAGVLGFGVGLFCFLMSLALYVLHVVEFSGVQIVSSRVREFLCWIGVILLAVLAAMAIKNASALHGDQVQNQIAPASGVATSQQGPTSGSAADR